LNYATPFQRPTEEEGAKPEQMAVGDLLAIKHALDDYWGPLDEPGGAVLRALHHPLFVHEFGETSLVVRDDDGGVAAYLLGLVAPRPPVGYIHLVDVREDRRRLGLGRLLYDAFESLVRSHGATSLKAIANPSNDGDVSRGSRVLDDARP
jgi:GNAT superfamily N-acetyltransferase